MSSEPPYNPNGKLKESIESNNLNSIIQQFDSLEISNIHLKNYPDFQWELIEASKLGVIEIVKYLIEQKKVNINCQESDFQRTPIFLASKHGHLEIVKYLHSKGADISIKESHGLNCFHAACSFGNLEILKFLTKMGSTQNQLKQVDCDGYTPLHSAILNGKFEIVKHLILEAGCDFRKLNKDQESYLLFASKYDNVEIVKFLIENGCIDQLEQGDFEDVTPVQIAANCGELEVIKYLISIGANVESQDRYGRTCVWFASEHDYVEILKYLIEIVGCDANQTTYHNETALIVASRSGRLNSLKYLISMGVDFEKSTYHSHLTPLQSAAENGHLEFTKYLIECGAKLCTLNELEIIPSMKRIGHNNKIADRFNDFTEKGALEFVKYLISIGFVVRSLDFDNACKIGCSEIVKYFISIGVHPTIEHQKGSILHGFLECTKYLIANLDVEPSSIKTSKDKVSHFVKQGKIEIIKFFCSLSGIYELNNFRDEDGQSLFGIACKSGNLEIVKFLVSIPFRNINMQDSGGRTALWLVCSTTDNLELLKYLVEDVGCDWKIGTEESTPGSIAKRNGHWKIAKYLSDLKSKSRESELNELKEELNELKEELKATKRKLELTETQLEQMKNK